MAIINEDIIELIRPILGNDVIISERIESNNNSVFIDLQSFANTNKKILSKFILVEE